MNRENREFIALFESSGWNGAEVARRLHTTRQSVSRYLSGEMAPKPAVIELFKMVLAHDNPAALAAATEAGRERERELSGAAHDKLEELKKDPAAHKQALELIDVLHDRMLIRAASESAKKERAVSYLKKRRRPSAADKKSISSGTAPSNQGKTPEDRIAEAWEQEAGQKPPRPRGGQ